MSRRAKILSKPVDRTSRRGFLKASAVVASAAAAQALPSNAMAQGTGATNPDELARLQGQRRILLRGGIVLTLDRQVGDFAQGRRTDRGRQDPRNPAGDRGVRRCGRGGRRHKPDRHSRLHRYPQPFLPGPAAEQPAERRRRSGLQPRHSEQHHAALSAAGRASRGAGDRARLHRHGHDHDGRHFAESTTRPSTATPSSPR